MAKFIWIPLISGRGRRQGAGDDYLWTQEIIENGDTEAVGLWFSRIQKRRRRIRVMDCSGQWLSFGYSNYDIGVFCGQVE